MERTVQATALLRLNRGYHIEPMSITLSLQRIQDLGLGFVDKPRVLGMGCICRAASQRTQSYANLRDVYVSSSPYTCHEPSSKIWSTPQLLLNGSFWVFFVWALFLEDPHVLGFKGSLCCCLCLCQAGSCCFSAGISRAFQSDGSFSTSW